MGRTIITKEDFPVHITLTVQWGEMDAYQHVNNIIYFRYFETTRIAYFERMGIIGDPEETVGPILASTSCKFIFPLSFPDEIIGTAKVTEILSDRFIMEYAVFSIAHKRIAAKGSGVVIPYDYSKKKKVALPESWIKVIQEIENVNGSQIGYEINISCPNSKKGGMEFGVDKDITKSLISQIRDFTDKTINDFQKDSTSLNNLYPDYEPRATEHISEMIKMIENLIFNEFAYLSKGHVLFNIKK